MFYIIEFIEGCSFDTFMMRMYLLLILITKLRSVRILNSHIFNVGEDGLSVVSNLYYTPSSGFYFVGFPDCNVLKGRISLEQIHPSLNELTDFNVQCTDNRTPPLESLSIISQASVVFLDFQHSYIRHYHHAIEHIIAAVNALTVANINPRDVKFVLMCFPGDDIKNGSPELMSEYAMKQIFYNARVLYSNQFKSFLNTTNTVLSKVVVSDRRMVASEIYKKTGKMLAGQLWTAPMAWVNAVDTVRNRLLSDASKGSPGKMYITVPRRKGTREMPQELFDSLIAKLQSLYGSEFIVSGVYHDKLTNAEQMQQALQTAAVIGVHGNALTHLVWMPRGSCVVEIFPKTCVLKCYSTLSHFANISYTAVSGHSGQLIRNEAWEALPVSNKDCNENVKEFDLTSTFEWMSANCPLLNKVRGDGVSNPTRHQNNIRMIALNRP